jgi:hypothetical protein
MMQFVITCPVASTHAHELARVFMQDVLLKVGFCGLIVIDDGNTFKGDFTAMCDKLDLRYHILSRGNHKALSVERYHRFLNKAITIAANDRGTNEVFVKAGAVSAYAWNSSPIDGTEITRSIPAVGREFKFPGDFTLGPALKPTQDRATAVQHYLQLTASDATLATAILKVVLEERRTAAREAVNATRCPIQYQVGDIVAVQIQVQSDNQGNRVQKLAYCTRGPFVIISNNGNGSYSMRPYDKSDGAVRTYPTEAISLLPACIRPCEPLDTPDLRFLNYHHAPLLHPLKSALNVELYNERWLDPTAATALPRKRPCPDDAIASPPAPAPTMPAEDPNAAATLLQTIAKSNDRLFFISFTPEGAMRAQWYLVEVDLESSSRCDLSRDYATTGTYYVNFYARHPSDQDLCDALSRWWLEWHEYETNEEGIIEFGRRILHRPNTQPNPAKYITYSDTLNLLDTTPLIGPFDFAPAQRSPSTSRTRQYVDMTHWHALRDACLDRGIQPPTISDDTQRRKKPRKSKA